MMMWPAMMTTNDGEYEEDILLKVKIIEDDRKEGLRSRKSRKQTLMK